MNDTTRQQIIELLTTPPTNGDTHTMEFISDSSHGWLKVPVSAYQLADAPASRFSYTDSDNVYLEEDADAPRFLKSVGITKRLDDGEVERQITPNGDSWVVTTDPASEEGSEAESWYIPERNLVNQRRYNEVSPRDMESLNDPAYVNPFNPEREYAQHLAESALNEFDDLVEIARQSGHLEIVHIKD